MSIPFKIFILNDGLVLLRLAGTVLSLINTGPCYVKPLKPKAIIAGPPKTQQPKNVIFIFSLIILM